MKNHVPTLLIISLLTPTGHAQTYSNMDEWDRTYTLSQVVNIEAILNSRNSSEECQAQKSLIQQGWEGSGGASTPIDDIRLYKKGLTLAKDAMDYYQDLTAFLDTIPTISSSFDPEQSFKRWQQVDEEKYCDGVSAPMASGPHQCIPYQFTELVEDDNFGKIPSRVADDSRSFASLPYTPPTDSGSDSLLKLAHFKAFADTLGQEAYARQGWGLSRSQKEKIKADLQALQMSIKPIIPAKRFQLVSFVQNNTGLLHKAAKACLLPTEREILLEENFIELLKKKDGRFSADCQDDLERLESLIISTAKGVGMKKPISGYDEGLGYLYRVKDIRERLQDPSEEIFDLSMPAAGAKGNWFIPNAQEPLNGDQYEPTAQKIQKMSKSFEMGSKVINFWEVIDNSAAYRDAKSSCSTWSEWGQDALDASESIWRDYMPSIPSIPSMGGGASGQTSRE